MAGDLFTKNTFVRGHGWFGPDYPANEVTSEVEAAVSAARGGGAGTGADRRGMRKAPQDAAPAATTGQDAPDTGGDGGTRQTVGTPPPKGGAKATKAAWADYAQANAVEVEDGASRDDIIAALDAAGVQTDAE